MYAYSAALRVRLGPTKTCHSFEAVMTRENRTKGFFVSFDFSSDALSEIGSFFKNTGKVIVPLTVRDILDEELARKLA